MSKNPRKYPFAELNGLQMSIGVKPQRTEAVVLTVDGNKKVQILLFSANWNLRGNSPSLNYTHTEGAERGYILCININSFLITSLGVVM